MKNLLKKYISKKVNKVEKEKEESEQFYPMTLIPPKDGDEPFSILVIVYDASDNRYFDLGYYDFEECKWKVLRGDVMNLKCWCHVPDSTSFLLKKRIYHH